MGALPFRRFCGAAPDTPDPQRHVTNTVDELFVQLFGEGGLAEVDLGELAVDQAASDEVRAFAQRMVKDHGTPMTG